MGLITVVLLTCGDIQNCEFLSTFAFGPYAFFIVSSLKGLVSSSLMALVFHLCRLQITEIVVILGSDSLFSWLVCHELPYE